jgi:hypothetical protein
MKVKDFIKELEKLPQDSELFAKDEQGLFYPADIIKRADVYDKQYIILGVQHI